jgi:hypothetical protein
MRPIRELFVSYTRHDGEQPILRLVEDRETLETIKNGAPLFKHVGSIIDVDSTDEADPILTIACVTDTHLKVGEPERITDEVIAWLRDINEWWN